MEKSNYLQRIADELLLDKLESSAAVLVQGPKWCGKTTTAEMAAKSVLYIDEPGKKDKNLEIARMNPSLLLKGKTPRLIDEWQLAPEIWDAVRFKADHEDGFGQIILTGSAVPADMSKVSHSGTGRIARLTMRPMSLFESKDSSGEVSLKRLFSGETDIEGVNPLTLEQTAFCLCRGGWPKAIGKPEKIALSQVLDYYDGLVNTDISRVDDVERNPQRVQRLLRSYSRNIASQATIATILKDLKSNETDTFDEDTAASYIKALKKLFVIEDLSAWNPNLRSKTVIRTSDTRHLVDPSVAVAALGLGPQDLMGDPNTFGLLFESMCIRDLRIYAESIGGTVYHYRDRNGLEADAVIHLRNGNWAPVEVKLFSDVHINEGAKNLNKLASIIDTEKMNQPSFKMIITATPFAYKREDGTLVVPISCLRN
jgi:predicted AAA+ superfamily ATPase